jgi:hypothetical protein
METCSHRVLPLNCTDEGVKGGFGSPLYRYSLGIHYPLFQPAYPGVDYEGNPRVNSTDREKAIVIFCSGEMKQGISLQQ